MNREELEKYLQPSMGSVIAAIPFGILGIIMLVVGLAGAFPALLGALIFCLMSYFFASSSIKERKKMKEALDEMERQGILGMVLADFQVAGNAFGDNLKMGQQWVYGKKSGRVIHYNEITQVYQFIHKTNFIEDSRKLRAVVGGKVTDIASIPIRGKGDEELKSVILYMLNKNPNIKVGYK